MEKTSSAAPSSRGFISWLSLWGLIQPVILCLLSVNAFGLFSSEFFYPNRTDLLATGNILSLDRSRERGAKRLEIATSWFYFTALRDTVTLADYLPDTSFGLDVIFIPGFLAFDDTGVSNMIFPFSFAANAQWTFLRLGPWSAGSYVYGGAEIIPEYTYLFNPVYGLRVYGQWDALDFLSAGLSAGLTDLKTYFMEGAVLFRLASVDLAAAFTLDGNYKTLRAGMEYRVTPGFSVLAGGNYTLEYNGWNATAGLSFSGFHVFTIPTKIALALQYNIVAGLSGTLAWTMEFGKIEGNATETQSPREE